jgi:hypothetical protein
MWRFGPVAAAEFDAFYVGFGDHRQQLGEAQMTEACRY